MIGLRGIYVDDPEQMGTAWDQALASDIPVVLEVMTDPEVPPLPPHITLQQCLNELDFLVGAVHRAEYAINAVARISENVA